MSTPNNGARNEILQRLMNSKVQNDLQLATLERRLTKLTHHSKQFAVSVPRSSQARDVARLQSQGNATSILKQTSYQPSVNTFVLP